MPRKAYNRAAMKPISLVLLFSVACGASQPPVTIKTEQDFDNVVEDIIKKVIDIFNSDGMNCEILAGDLREVRNSQKMAAAKEYRNAHPEAQQKAKEKVSAHKPELEKAWTPGLKQCGAQLQSTLKELTE